MNPCMILPNLKWEDWKAHPFSPKYVLRKVIQHKGYSFKLIGTSTFHLAHESHVTLAPKILSRQSEVIKGPHDMVTTTFNNFTIYIYIYIYNGCFCRGIQR